VAGSDDYDVELFCELHWQNVVQTLKSQPWGVHPNAFSILQAQSGCSDSARCDREAIIAKDC
jgi:hypothetical protein